MLRMGVLSAPFSNALIIKRCLRRQQPSVGKPPVMPPSKTRLYRMSEPQWMVSADVADLLWRRHVYNSAILSLRHVFREEMAKKRQIDIGTEQIRKAEKEELEQKLAENEERNRQLAEARIERDQKLMVRVEAVTLKEIERRLLFDAENAERRTKEVQEVIDRSHRFVTRENMDQRILDALENPVTFDYCIDLHGARMEDPVPVKYLVALPTRKPTGRMYDLKEGFTPTMVNTRPALKGYSYKGSKQSIQQPPADERKDARRKPKRNGREAKEGGEGGGEPK